jgi:hypothetical protein
MKKSFFAAVSAALMIFVIHNAAAHVENPKFVQKTTFLTSHF